MYANYDTSNVLQAYPSYQNASSSKKIVPWDQFSETWSCIVPWEKVMDILKQLTCIASVKTKIRNKFKVVSTEKLCMAVFINCKGRVF